MSQAERVKLSKSLPDFPWDSLAEAKNVAASHPEGIVDLSVGTPVDPTPALVRAALTGAADAPGYPTVWGSQSVHDAIIGYLDARWHARGLTSRNVLPVIGTKEFVGWLPTFLHLGPGDLVVIPELAYPTYEVGAAMVGANVQRCDDPAAVTGRPALIWINSPANPHGATLDTAALRRWVDYARSQDAILASDECYGEFGWESEPSSILDQDVCSGGHSRLLALHSTSKRSNMAGYRAGFVAGDHELVTELIALRKHLGMMVPDPVQAALAAALADQTHVDEQRGRYLRRRDVLRAALEEAGFRIDHSQGSLYLWATRGEPCRDTVAWLARRGILAAPGEFYGPAGAQHVRIALTATDERIDSAVSRLNRGE